MFRPSQSFPAPSTTFLGPSKAPPLSQLPAGFLLGHLVVFETLPVPAATETLPTASRAPFEALHYRIAV